MSKRRQRSTLFAKQIPITKHTNYKSFAGRNFFSHFLDILIFQPFVLRIGIRLVANNVFCSCFAAIISSTNLFAQEKLITLQEVIELAKKQSPAAKKANNSLQNKFWQYKSYRASLKPQLALNGTLPDFNRSIQATPQNDGTIPFRPRTL